MALPNHIPPACSVARRLQLASFMLLGCLSVAWAANKVAELNDEFLEYLGTLEGDADNWTDFTSDAVAARSTDDGKVSQSSSSAAKPAVVPVTKNAQASSASASSMTSTAAPSTGKVER